MDCLELLLCVIQDHVDHKRCYLVCNELLFFCYYIIEYMSLPPPYLDLKNYTNINEFLKEKEIKTFKNDAGQDTDIGLFLNNIIQRFYYKIKNCKNCGFDSIPKDSIHERIKKKIEKNKVQGFIINFYKDCKKLYEDKKDTLGIIENKDKITENINSLKKLKEIYELEIENSKPPPEVDLNKEFVQKFKSMNIDQVALLSILYNLHHLQKLENFAPPRPGKTKKIHSTETEAEQEKRMKEIAEEYLYNFGHVITDQTPSRQYNPTNQMTEEKKKNIFERILPEMFNILINPFSTQQRITKNKRIINKKDIYTDLKSILENLKELAHTKKLKWIELAFDRCIAKVDKKIAEQIRIELIMSNRPAEPSRSQIESQISISKDDDDAIKNMFLMLSSYDESAVKETAAGGGSTRKQRCHSYGKSRRRRQ